MNDLDYQLTGREELTMTDDYYGYRVGNIPVVMGRVKQDEENGPVIFAAALSEQDLRHESCGYGTTEAEAVADLFRLMR